MPWSTPLKVRNHLLPAIDQRLTWPNTSIWPPQASRGVYIVTERLWNGYAYPNPNLVGPPKIRSSAMLGRALHGIPPQFAYRFGLLLIGLAGYGDQTWIAQNAYDLLSYVGWENPIMNPLDFYCTWRTDYQCPSCAEVQLYSFFCRTVKQGTLSAVTTTIHLIP
jgi:hypothetical protein